MDNNMKNLIILAVTSLILMNCVSFPTDSKDTKTYTFHMRELRETRENIRIPVPFSASISITHLELYQGATIKTDYISESYNNKIEYTEKNMVIKYYDLREMENEMDTEILTITIKAEY